MEKTARNMSNAELLEILCGSVGRTLARHPLPEVFGICTPRHINGHVEQDMAPYQVHPKLAVAKELYIRAIEQDMKSAGISLSSPQAVTSYLSGRIGHYEHEVFLCLWTDVQNRLIVAEEIFRGTLTQTSIYPRELAKSALIHNAAGVILAHNHPSGETSPSRADELLTAALKTTLALVDVRVVDHFVVAGNKTLSFAEKGLL